MSAAALLRSTGHEKLDETTARDVARFLRNRGLRASPSLFSVLADLGEERWEPGEFDAPGLVVDAARLERARITVGPSRLPALGGAVCAGVVVSCIGLYRSPASALVAAVPALVAVAGIWAWPPA